MGLLPRTLCFVDSKYIYYFDGSKWYNTVCNLKQVSAGKSGVFGLHARTNAIGSHVSIHLSINCLRSGVTSVIQKGTFKKGTFKKSTFKKVSFIFKSVSYEECIF